MNRHTLTLLLTIAAWIAVPAGAAAQETVSSAITTARVETALAMSETVSAFDIATSTGDGAVLLEGTVNTAAERRAAERLAKAVTDGMDVENHIKVKDWKQKEHLDKAGQQKPERLWIREFGETAKDIAVAARVESALAYHNALDDTLLATAEDGVVTIAGTVDTKTEKALAKTVAMKVSGVKEVQTNNIDVREEQATMEDGGETMNVADVEAPLESIDDAANDGWVEMAVETRILTSPVSLWDIDVEVSDNVAHLSGTVIAEEERKMAERIAEETDGVTSVLNSIQVADWEEEVD